MYSRQVNIFKPEEFNTPVHVIGCGATGSWLALALAKLGVKNLHIWDFDTIEEHNLPNQVYKVEDIGELKVNALQEDILKRSGVTAIKHEEKVDGSQRLSGVIFMLTDTMKSREEIFNKAIQNNPNIKFFVETRMDLKGGRIYAFDPKDRNMCKKYKETLYTDDQAEVSACGVSQTVITTGIGIVSQALWIFLNWVNSQDIPNEILLDCSNFYQINSKW